MPLRSGFHALAAVSGLLLLPAPGAHAGLTDRYYTVTDLGTLGGGTSWANGINDAGQIVGAAQRPDGSTHAFLWSGGQMHDLGTLGGTASEALGINAYGVAAGYACVAAGTRKPARWSGGVIQDLAPGGPGGTAYGLNNSGVCVGTLGNKAVVWTGTGTVTLPIGSAFPLGINNAGTIVATDHMSGFGTTGKVWVDQVGGAWKPIPYAGIFAAINNSGSICITAEAELYGGSAFQPALDFSVDAVGSLQPGTSQGYAGGINDAGEVVGQQGTYDQYWHAFLSIPGTGALDLNSHIDPNSGWALTFARGINSAGQIVGYGTIQGRQHAFLLSPASPPPHANLQVSPSLDLGAVTINTGSTSRRLTLTNDGDQPLTISHVVLDKLRTGEFQVSGGTGLTVAPGASTDLTINFSPRAVGSRSLDFKIISNALDSPTDVKLTGTGVPPPPGAPSSLSASAFGYGKINLAWKDNSSNETAFEVFRSIGTGSFSRITVLAPNSTSYTDYTVAGSTTYTYEVCAANDTWVSAFSNPASVTTAFPPAAPTILTLAGHSYNKVSLGWTDNSNNETAFEIYRKTGSGAYSLIGVVAPNTTFFQDTTVSPQTSYSYQVRAANDYYASAYTNALSVTTVVAPPASPSGLSAMALGAGKILLSWSDNSTNETAYELYRQLGNGSFVLLAVLGPNSTGYTDTGIVGSTSYAYKVRAANSLWASGFSNTAMLTTQFSPAAPSALTATSISSTQINLAWTDNSSNETAFEVYRATGAGSYVLVAVLAPNTTTYADKSAVAGTSYSYRVRAANDYWASAYTNIASAHTP